MWVHNCPPDYRRMAAEVLPRHFDRLQSAMKDPNDAQLFVGHRTAAKSLLKALGTRRKKDFAGCYVFLRGCRRRPLYVGISRKVIARICQHVNGKTHNDTSLVYLMAERIVGKERTRARTMRKEGFQDVFDKKQEMLRRCRVAFIPIKNPLELYLFEVYAAMKLGTGRWNSFRTH